MFAMSRLLVAVKMWEARNYFIEVPAAGIPIKQFLPTHIWTRTKQKNRLTANITNLKCWVYMSCAISLKPVDPSCVSIALTLLHRITSACNRETKTVQYATNWSPKTR